MTPTRRLDGERWHERRRRQRSQEPARDPLVGRERTARSHQKRAHHGDHVEDRASHTLLCWLLQMEVVPLPPRRPPLHRLPQTAVVRYRPLARHPWGLLLPPLHRLPQTAVVWHRPLARHPWGLLPHRSSLHRWLQSGRPRCL